MTIAGPLLRLLCDGQFHSGPELGERLGVSRAAVWKQISRLETLGLEVHAVSGKGYRLAAPLELLDRGRVMDALDPAGKKRLHELEILDEIDSTNSYLMGRARQSAPSGLACLAESQSAGRGRVGRHWVSTFGANVYLSLLWRYSADPAALGGLSIAVGVAVAQALRDSGICGVQLKWPNDILWEGRKLAGVLIEVSGESAGPCAVVAGIGVNVRLPEAAAREIDQPWVDLGAVPGGETVSRNRLAGRIIEQVLTVLDGFERTGLGPWLPKWRRLDGVIGHPVSLHLPDGPLAGTARGVDAQGALLLERDGEISRYACGEISLRSRRPTAPDDVSGNCR
jgi:BirA family biotin operon repressor/biotin-[acetyl-CoA-carboxylase] ligase